MEYKDYYRILGISKDAPPEEVRKAYRSLARKYHPDVNPNDKGAEEHFKEINEAYEVVRDPDKREKYDRLGANWSRYQQMGGDPHGFDWSQWFAGGQPGAGSGRVYTEQVDLNDLFGDGGFSDFFQTIFGGGAGRARGRSFAIQGRDIEQPVTISLKEAFQGTTRILQTGQRRIEVKIPPGVRAGSRVRVAGEGQPGHNGGQPGNLYLIISTREHPAFRREGDDLHMRMPVDLYTAILGGEVLVQTLKGRVSLKIPAGTDGGQIFRLRGQGMPSLRKPSQHGDLYVEIQPTVPQDLSEQEQKLFQQLADMREEKREEK
jgi:curved DNA-binding protein